MNDDIRFLRKHCKNEASVEKVLQYLNSKKGYSNAFYQYLFKSIPNLVQILDINGSILFASDALRDKINKPVIGKKCFEVLKNSSTACDTCPVGKKLAEGKTIKRLDTLFENRIFEVSHTGIILDNGEPGFIEVFYDVSAHKASVDAHKRLLEKTHLVLNNMTDIIYSYDVSRSSKKGMPIFISKSIKKVSGYDLKEFFDNPRLYMEIVHPDDREKVAQIAIKTIKTTRVNQIIYRIRHKTKGKYIWLEDRMKAIKNKMGEVIIVQGVARNIDKRISIEQAFKQSQLRFKGLIENTSVGICIHQDRQFVYANKVALRLLGGTKKSQLIGTDVLEVIPADNVAPMLKRMKSVYKTGKSFKTVNEQLKALDGTIFYAQINASRCIWKGRDAIQVVILDITKEYEQSKALLESESKYRNLLENSPLAIAIHQDGKVVYCNKCAQKSIGGRSNKKLLGTPVYDLLAPGERPKVKKRIEQQIKSGKAVPVSEEKWIKLDGSPAYFEVMAMPVKWEGRLAFQVIGKEITELKLHRLAFDKLQNATMAKTGNCFFRHLVKSISQILDADMVFAGSYNKEDNTVKSLAVWENGKEGNPLIYSLENTPCQNVINRKHVIIDSKVSEKYPEDEFLQENHIEAFVGYPLLDSKGRVSGILVALFKRKLFNSGLLKDIFALYSNRSGAELERQQSVEALAISEEKFRKAFKTSPDAININRMSDGKYVEVSDGFKKISGWTEEEIIGKNAIEINIWTNMADREKLVEELSMHGYMNNYEATFRMKDGRIVSGLMSATIIQLNGEAHILSITRDISEWKKSEEFLQNILMLAPSGILVINESGQIEKANRNAAQILGYENKEMEGMMVEDFLDIDIRFNHKKKRLQAINEPKSKLQKVIQKEILRTDKSRVPVNIHLNTFTHNEKDWTLLIMHDISELKDKEIELEHNLREKEVMLSELHHRVKNNMQVINGLLQMQIDRISNEEAGRILKDARNRIQAMAIVHNQLYRTDNMSSINIKNLAYYLAHNIMQGFGKMLEQVKLEIGGQDVFLPIRKAIPASLIMNEIITNAYKYAFPKGRQGVLNIQVNKKGRNLIIDIGDDGIGMLPAQKAESGLGSHLIQMLAEGQLNGKVSIKEKRNGVKYRLQIPLA